MLFNTIQIYRCVTTSKLTTAIFRSAAGDDSVWWINAALLPEGLSGEEVQFVWRSAGWRGVMAGGNGKHFFPPNRGD